jgi:hypothetical protein
MWCGVALRCRVCGAISSAVQLTPPSVCMRTTAQFNFYNIAIGYFDKYDELYLAPSLDDSRLWAARERLVVIRREKQQHSHEKMGVSNSGEHTAAPTLDARRFSMFTSRVASHHHHTLGGMANDGAAGAALVRE